MITILGPTASGKTPLAVALAARVGGEIISADSRQVYRRMDIGTGKDLEDYIVHSSQFIVHSSQSTVHSSLTSKAAEPSAQFIVHSSQSTVHSSQSKVQGFQVPYHLIDICEPGTKYNLFQYQQDFFDAYNNIIGRGKVPILCGGTGLYIEAVLKGYQLSPVPQNPELRAQLEDKSLEELTMMLKALKQQNGSVMHNTTDVDSCQRAIRAIEIETSMIEEGERRKEEGKRRKEEGEHLRTSIPPINSLIIGVNIDRDMRREKISCRLKARLDEGMVEEVRALLEEGIPAEDLIYYGLEYKYVTEYIIGKLTYGEMFRQLEIAIHQFAKRQMTWFRGMERRGFTIHWIDATLPMEEKVNLIMSYAS